MTNNSTSTLNLQSLFYTVPLGFLFVIETYVFKLIQLREITGKLDIIAAGQALAPDLAVFMLLTLVTSILLSRNNPVIKGIGFCGFYLFMFYALFISAFSHGYFLVTGTSLSWSTIVYWVNNTSATNNIIESEATAAKLGLLAAQIILFVACIIVPNLKKIRQWIDFKDGITPKKSRVIAATLLALSPFFFAIPGRPEAAALSRSIPVSILSEFAHEVLLSDRTVTLRKEDLIDPELHFEKKPGAPSPNIVLIILESFNWKSSDVYVPGQGTTPFLAELAPKSTIINNQYAIIPHTTKALVPIMCGINPYLATKAKETTQGILPRRCLPHILESQGYQTAFFQTATNFEKRSQLVSNMGFDSFKYVKNMPTQGFEKIAYLGREEKMMIEPSMEWLDSVKGSPFFVTYLTLCTHHNYMTPQSFEYVDFPTNDKDKKNFLNAVRYTDDFVRELFARFEQKGLIDNTVFILLGDHGEGFAEHGRRQHDVVMWEEGLRAVGMLYSPTYFPKPGRIHGMRSHLDILPTITDLLGLELENGSLSGQSLLAPVPDDRKLFYSCWFNRQCLAMREGPVKTIYFYGIQPMEVYDNSKDEFEQTNLALTPPYDQAFLDARRDEMLRWRTASNQQYEVWEKALSQGKVTDQKPFIANKLQARFGKYVELVGYEATPSRATADQDVEIKFVFKCLKEMPSSKKLFVHLNHRSGTKNADHVPVSGTMPLHKWKAGQYITDEHTIRIPGDWATGTLNVHIGFWDTITKKRMVITETDAPINDMRLLAIQIPITKLETTKTLTQSQVREKIKNWISFKKPTGFDRNIGAVFGNAVELTGVTLERTDVKLAGTVEMTYAFRNLSSVPPDWHLTVKLIMDDGKASINGDHVPIGGLYPTKLWREGEYIVDKHKIHIDMYKSKIGTYSIWLGFKDGPHPVTVSGEGEFDSKNRIKLGTVTISKGEGHGRIKPKTDFLVRPSAKKVN